MRRKLRHKSQQTLKRSRAVARSHRRAHPRQQFLNCVRLNFGRSDAVQIRQDLWTQHLIVGVQTLRLPVACAQLGKDDWNGSIRRKL